MVSKQKIICLSLISAGIYASSLALLSVLLGGSLAASKARKTQDEFFKNVENHSVKTSQALHAEGVSLAFRALAWGTVWAVGGCSVIFFGIWKFSGATDVSFDLCRQVFVRSD